MAVLTDSINFDTIVQFFHVNLPTEFRHPITALLLRSENFCKCFELEFSKGTERAVNLSNSHEHSPTVNKMGWEGIDGATSKYTCHKVLVEQIENFAQLSQPKQTNTLKVSLSPSVAMGIFPWYYDEMQLGVVNRRKVCFGKVKWSKFFLHGYFSTLLNGVRCNTMQK